MSWHWSRLSILAFLILLYVSPLSTGDKGLWLSVTSLPVQALGTAPERLPAEHSSLVSDQGARAVALSRSERHEHAPAPTWLASSPPGAGRWSARLHEPWCRGAFDPICPAPAAPRGPPV